MSVKANREGWDGKCTCHACIEAFGLEDAAMPGWPLDSTRMIVCPECGNKRCPKASNHALQCTGSNESGQPGSIYQGWKP